MGVIMAGPRNMVSIIAFFLSSLLFIASYLRIEPVANWNGFDAPAGPAGPKPRYIFVDLGANGADSLEVFLKHENTKFQYDFPHPEWATYDQAEIFLFEANPVFNLALIRAKEKYDAVGIKVNIFPSTVIDVKDGTRKFFLDTINTGHDFWGSSIYANHPDAVKSESKGTELTSINFSRWLLMNTLPRDFVVVKIDVEGAEYELVPHMVEMATWTVVDHLLIEWHDVGVSQEDIDLAKVATQKLKDQGVDVPFYDSAA